jgi:hypothetical protein
MTQEDLSAHVKILNQRLIRVAILGIHVSLYCGLQSLFYLVTSLPCLVIGTFRHQRAAMKQHEKANVNSKPFPWLAVCHEFVQMSKNFLPEGQQHRTVQDQLYLGRHNRRDWHLPKIWTGSVMFWFHA